MNYAVVLAISAGLAIASQVVVNTLGLRSLGIGALVGISGLATALAGFAVAFFLARPELTGKTVLYGVASGLMGAFILSAITLAAGRAGLAQTLSLVVGVQLLAGLAIDRVGLFGPAVADIGPLKVLGVVLVVAGGVLVVRG